MSAHDLLSRRILITAAVAGATGVLLGAFGAHGLEQYLAERLGEQLDAEPDKLAKRLGQFDVGVRYHLVHAVALLALAAFPSCLASDRRWVFRLLVAGLFLFSGSLYLLVLIDLPVLGAITPIGGVCWIVGWLWLVPVALRRSPDSANGS